jgi:hypothetical protein
MLNDGDGGEVRHAAVSHWEKLVALPSPLPLGRRMEVNQEAVTFAGRMWWVDVTWGAISADPFSDRPDLHFIELPRENVTEPMERAWDLGRYRRMGVSDRVFLPTGRFIPLRSGKGIPQRYKWYTAIYRSNSNSKSKSPVQTVPRDIP